jgi:hypothetical protein
MPKGACVLGGVAKTDGGGGGGCAPKDPKVAEEVVLEREGLAGAGPVHVGDQPPDPSKQTPRYLA